MTSMSLCVKYVCVVCIVCVCRDSLVGESQTLWIAVFTHFNRLHAARVMEAKEIAAVFVPCLVADRSQYQDCLLYTSDAADES